MVRAVCELGHEHGVSVLAERRRRQPQRSRRIAEFERRADLLQTAEQRVIEQGGNATVSDVDSTDFNSGTLTVSFMAGSDSAEDVMRRHVAGFEAAIRRVLGGSPSSYTTDI